MKKKELVAAFLSLSLFSSVNALAGLSSGTTLAFEPGVVECIANAGTPPDNCTYASTVNIGSYFGMEPSPGFVIKTPMEVGPGGGLIMGQIQLASGTHGGLPGCLEGESGCAAPYGVAENPNLDMPWVFFGNTGMHMTFDGPAVIDPDVNGDGGFTQTINLPWSVTWNEIPSIPIGGVVTVVCDQAGCPGGSNFVLDYAISIPPSDEHGFGNVPYSLHLVGTVLDPVTNGPTVAGIFPASASAGDTIYVFGATFVEGATSVTVNGIQVPSVEPLGTDEAQITFVLPAGDTNGTVNVTTPDGTTVGPVINGPTIDTLSVSAVWPESGSIYSIRFIFGTGFVEGQTQIFINGLNQPYIQFLSPEVVLVLVDQGTTTGPVMAVTPLGSATSSGDLVVLP